MSRRNRSRKSKSNGVLAKLVIGTLIFVLLAFICTLVYLSITGDRPVYDEVTMCRKDILPTNIYAVLIDATDSLPEKTASQAIVKIKQALNEAPDNSLVNLYSINSGNESHVLPMFSFCKPQSGDSVDELTSNPELIKKRFNEKFSLPLSEYLTSMISFKASSTSPIIESLQSTVIESFEGVKHTGDKVIIIFSDMIQNSKMYSFYKVKPDFERYKKLTSLSGRGNVDLSEVMIRALVVPKKPPVGSRADVLLFWTEFFQYHRVLIGSKMEPLS